MGDSFNGLKDAIPTLQVDKSSRAQILKKASEYIAFMRRKNGSHSSDIETSGDKTTIWRTRFEPWRKPRALAISRLYPRLNMSRTRRRILFRKRLRARWSLR